ncbi:MAG: bilirubin oxidase [Sphingobacteriales bacterium]|nr:MAG: bilirubin oxidase [Sphingobacteriales bacterium]
MKKVLLLLLHCCVAVCAHAQYNNLWIPDTLSGTQFNLSLRDTFTQLLPGNQTITGGINGRFWGPTLIFRRGDTVRMDVHNKLNDSTTIHWHGLHLPAVMDGGPHQVIPPNTHWMPYWKVTDQAATLWYHPHLHEMTAKQVASGLGGMIILRDSQEASLPLPRTYGIDDIPLVLSDRKFNSANQFVVQGFGDTMLTNFTLNAQKTLPAQMVRFRVLNASVARTYNLGFSDNRNFYVIGSDAGLLQAPVIKNRMLISPGERVELVVSLTGQQGTTPDLMAFNAEVPATIPGGQIIPPATATNALAGRNFRLLHLVVGAPTAAAVHTLPAVLSRIPRHDTSGVQAVRKLLISDSLVNGQVRSFLFNHRLFNFNYNEFRVPLTHKEIWEITSTSVITHPFHIHDIEFNVLDINGQPPAPEEAGWKDVVMIPAPPRDTAGRVIQPTVVRFIGQFNDYADSVHPFMFHCHILTHEDGGMMGQFLVTDQAAGVQTAATPPMTFSVFPNPAQDRLFLQLDQSRSVYYVWITDRVGRTMYMLPEPEWQNGINISSLRSGLYYLTILEKKTGRKATQSFIKN